MTRTALVARAVAGSRRLGVSSEFRILVNEDYAMSGNAVLLMDLENFFLGREFNYHRDYTEETYDFGTDLDDLCLFAEQLAGGRRIIRQRAYANFNDRRPGDAERRWDYYLQPLPRMLMDQGVEPVQVFRYPGGTNRSHSELRLALDASGYARTEQVEMVILVTGDSDCIPLIQELRSTGTQVVLIGVAGATKPLFQRYCDRFEYFEDLVRAAEVENPQDAEVIQVKQALHNLLDRTRPMRVAAIKPLLSRELNRPFDPTRFDCENTADFLQSFSGELGVEVRGGEAEGEVDRSASYSRSAPEAPTIPAMPSPRDYRPVHHSASFYRNLLRYGTPRLYVAPADDWMRITEAVHGLSASTEQGVEKVVFHEELLSRVAEACEQSGMEEAGKKTNDTMFLLFKSGCFQCAEESSRGATDFHWSRPAMLDPEIHTEHDLRERCWLFMIRVLERRLSQPGNPIIVQPEALAHLLFGIHATAEHQERSKELAERARSVTEPLPR